MESAGDPATRSPGRASEWLVALREAPDDTALRRRFECWLSADPAHLADWREIERTDDAFDRLRQARDRPPNVAVATPYRPPRRRLAFGLAAAVALAGLAIVAGPDIALRIDADHVTGTAEQQTVALPDGSTVRLAPRSAIGIAFDDSGRRIRLLRGEAFFDVVHDTGRPFVVEASGTKATDLGTAFDVRLGPEGTEVAVRHGLVRVDSTDTQPAVSELLQAGDWIRATARRPAERGHLPVEAIGAWTQHRLIVKSRPVSEIIDALRPYFNGVIVVRNDELARRSTTGVYNLSDPVEALRAVARAQGATVHQISPWLLILSGA
jgi:transmembrane sensor